MSVYSVTTMDKRNQVFSEFRIKISCKTDESFGQMFQALTDMFGVSALFNLRDVIPGIKNTEWSWAYIPIGRTVRFIYIKDAETLSILKFKFPHLS